MNNNTDPAWDAIVIGGGVAGLSGALTLLRARRNVLVLETGATRNRFTDHMHAVLGRDGTDPADLIADGRTEVEGYGGVIRHGAVTEVRGEDGRFEVVTDDGNVETARRILVASGVRDVLPEIPGLTEAWGRGVAVCPYCDGYEVRDQPIGILATEPFSIFQAQLLRQWSDDIIYFPGADDEEKGTLPDGDDLVGFSARDIRIEPGEVARVTTDADGNLNGLEMSDGRHIPLAAIFTFPAIVPADGFLAPLNPERSDLPMGSFLQVDPTGLTSVPGIWAAGNISNPGANVPISIGAGAAAAGMLNHGLILDDVERAVRVRQTGQPR